MRKFLKMTLIAAVSVAFMGCPYKTKVNLESSPSEKVESKLLGEYEKKGSTTYKYEVTKHDANHYKLKEIKNSDGKTTYEYIGYTTTIKGTQFLVTRRTKSYSTDYSNEENPSYYLYKVAYNSAGSVVKLYELSENITEEFESAAELKAFIGKYKDLSFFYEKKALKFYKNLDDEDF